MKMKKLLLLTLAPLMLTSCGGSNWVRKMGLHPGFYDESLVASEMTKSGTTYYVVDIAMTVNSDTTDLVVTPADFTVDGKAAAYLAKDYAVPGGTTIPELNETLTTYTFTGKAGSEMGGVLVCFTAKATNTSTYKYICGNIEASCVRYPNF